VVSNKTAIGAAAVVGSGWVVGRVGGAKVRSYEDEHEFNYRRTEMEESKKEKGYRRVGVARSNPNPPPSESKLLTGHALGLHKTPSKQELRRKVEKLCAPAVCFRERTQTQTRMRPRPIHPDTQPQ
jgi:hypothetical protein